MAEQDQQSVPPDIIRQAACIGCDHRYDYDIRRKALNLLSAVNVGGKEYRAFRVEGKTFVLPVPYYRAVWINKVRFGHIFAMVELVNLLGFSRSDAWLLAGDDRLIPDCPPIIPDEDEG